METTAVELADQRGNVWTIVGAKGGVGKTTLATNLAAVIATRTPRTVLLIDLDTRFGDITVLLDLKPRFSVADLARAFRSEISTDLLHQALIPHESGAYVLAAPAHPIRNGSDRCPNRERGERRHGEPRFEPHAKQLGDR